MYQNLIYSIIVAFALFAIGNIVMRFTVFKMYQQMRNKGIDINTKGFFNQKYLEDEVSAKYKSDSALIFRFVKFVRYAMTFASILLFFILIMAYLLLKMQS